MATSRKSPLQDLPAAVRIRGKKGVSPKAALSALIAHYGLEGRYAKIATAAGELEIAKAESEFYRGLAFRLMTTFLPAFRNQAAGGRRRAAADVNEGEWSNAGNSIIGGPTTVKDWENFYGAQLVVLVAKLMSEKKKSQAWVFKYLTQTKTRSLLPRIFRNRKTPGSLKNAYSKKISAEVRGLTEPWSVPP